MPPTKLQKQISKAKYARESISYLAYTVASISSITHFLVWKRKIHFFSGSYPDNEGLKISDFQQPAEGHAFSSATVHVSNIEREFNAFLVERNARIQSFYFHC